MSEYCSFHGHYDSAEPHCPGCDYDGRPQAGTPPKVKEQGLGDAQLSSSNSNASSAQRAAAPSDPSLNALAMEAAHRVCLYLVEVHNLIVYPRVEKEIASTISRAISAACPTCGSEDGVPKVRCSLEHKTEAQQMGCHGQQWHARSEEHCHKYCKPCPVCSAKQSGLLERVLIDEAEQRGEEIDKEQPKCPVHGEGYCHWTECGQHPQFDDPATGEPGGLPHFACGCGCPQEQGSGDAAEGQGGKGASAQGDGRIPSGSNQTPVKAAAAPDPSPLLAFKTDSENLEMAALRIARRAAQALKGKP